MTPAGHFAVPAGHPALPGHFPGNPVVPGVVLLDHVACAILDAHPAHRLCGVPQAKFLRPVRPDETVHVAYDPAPPRIAFTARVGDEVAIRGVLLLAETE